MQLSVNASGEWSIQDGASSRPVLLLQHQSVWMASFAGISLQQTHYPAWSSMVLWFWRSEQKPGHWRRARVRFTHAV
ncbi:MAG: hypothetical protein GY727_02500 [Gammaproteobacteria bacterium]|nr:hypothetical protein [Gammaproteobacteria bacterium]MCP4088803.1 hypothetical protein [Gammaproteobacteria bacterium]MCP4275898.1 hypothetical protein [Gammaproteobacteria bacterium]MCP4832114.1 hypothetical protein [Gammaproteobacteria bacterium]